MHLLHCEVPEQGVLPPAQLLLRGKQNEFRSDEMRFSRPDNRTTAAYQNIVFLPKLSAEICQQWIIAIQK